MNCPIPHEINVLKMSTARFLSFKYSVLPTLGLSAIQQKLKTVMFVVRSSFLVVLSIYLSIYRTI